ncbi:MAG: hypothetical protein AAFO95_10325 [Cyanobacteria bacterium J06600_6]
MKYQLLLLSLIGTALGANLLETRPSQAEPAPVFQPIIQDIRDRLSTDFQMRLPAALPEFTKSLDLYAFVADDEMQVVNIKGQDVFSVIVSDLPNCEQSDDPEDCIVGVISVTEALSDSALTPEDLPDNRQDLTPITLAEGAEGFYFTQNEEIQLVIWEQDNLGYLLMTEQCDDECVSKQQMIEMAQSAALQPPIYSLD